MYVKQEDDGGKEQAQDPVKSSRCFRPQSVVAEPHIRQIPKRVFMQTSVTFR